ncbi:major facilitator superfamily domain-containing protein [Usnea florida]
MNPPRNEEDVLDEDALASRHKGHTRAIAQNPLPDEENRSSLNADLSPCQSSTVNFLNEKPERPIIANALQHLSAKSTTDGRLIQEKSNGFSQTLSEGLQPNTEPDILALNKPNHCITTPAEEPISIEKNEPPDQAEAHDFPEGGLRAWLVVLGSFSGMTAGFGVLNSAGTFQVYLSMNQLAHESPSAVGWIFSLYAFLTFFCGVQIGPVFDAYGPRWLVFAGTVCLVGGMFGVAESTKLWHFLLTYSTLCGIGSSLIFTPAIGFIAHFFYKRRAAATGLATTGGSIGGIIFPLMLQRLFPDVGFKWATRILAFLFLFLLGIANLLIRGRLQPSKDSHVVQNIWPDWRIFKDQVFILTTAGVFFIEWALFIPLSYISSYALTEGVSPVFSYQLLAILNAGSFFGRWAPGYMADLFGRFNTMIITVALCLISVLAVWFTCSPEDGIRGIAQLVIFCVLFGFASGSNISLTPVCVGQLCETKVFGRWYASLYTVVSFGCLTGIPIAGQLLATDGGKYTGLIGFVGACYGAGLICFVWARFLKVGWSLRKIY